MNAFQLFVKLRRWMLAWLALGCLGPVLLAGSEHVFEVRGIVRGPVTEGTLLVEHQDIPGLMPAMTMPFYLGEGEPKVSLALGDEVRFQFVVGEGSSRAERFEVLDAARRSGKSGAIGKTFGSGSREGSLLPAFRLLDESGRSIRDFDLEGRYTVVTFIFTRCPVPEFCPLLSSKFARLQGLILHNPEFQKLDTEVTLLSVSLDPEWDRPNVLADYGRRVGANPDIWRFATGESSEVARLATFAGLSYSGEGVAISHDLRTLLVGPEGRLLEVWPGNRWKPEKVLEAIQARKASE
ncbi:SCO family protein [Pelagicoccus sp. SDUM812005]|uniref:SCO family protein n=1 Tax=Pelagicoccus sp. SDUM812005 TaxID=3041257 RepID=UPI00280FDB53|nr:SCO family protein [Pelagicoccus sp. SDUM812005]MDQ8182281.1 SCO family protein [Pelagicoccus sp. SDUM812005]